MKAPILICLSLILSTTAFSQGTDADLKREIKQAISQKHPRESSDWWLALGPKAPRTIIEIYKETTRMFWKVRLLKGLAWFKDDPEAVEFLKEEGKNTGNSSVRRMIIQSIGHTMGAREKDYIAQFLDSDDPHTRYHAAQALEIAHEASSDPAILVNLEKYRKAESQPWVLTKLSKAKINRAKAAATAPQKKKPTLKDLLSSKFLGDWRGFWIEPLGKKKVLRSTPTRVEISFVSDSELKAEVFLRNGKSRIQKIKGQGLRFSGHYPPYKKKGELRAELLDWPKETRLRLDLPKQGASFIGKRRP